MLRVRTRRCVARNGAAVLHVVSQHHKETSVHEHSTRTQACVYVEHVVRALVVHPHRNTFVLHRKQRAQDGVVLVTLADFDRHPPINMLFLRLCVLADGYRKNARLLAAQALISTTRNLPTTETVSSRTLARITRLDGPRAGRSPPHHAQHLCTALAPQSETCAEPRCLGKDDDSSTSHAKNRPQPRTEDLTELVLSCAKNESVRLR